MARSGSVDPSVLDEDLEDGVDDAVIEAGASKRHEETVVFGMTTQLVSAAVVSDERLGRGLMKRESPGLAEFAVQHGDDPAVEGDIGSIQADGFTDPHPSAGQQPDQCLVGDRLKWVAQQARCSHKR